MQGPQIEPKPSSLLVLLSKWIVAVSVNTRRGVDGVGVGYTNTTARHPFGLSEGSKDGVVCADGVCVWSTTERAGIRSYVDC